MTITDKTMQEYAREYLTLKAEIEALEAKKRKLAARFHEELPEGKATFGPYTITTWEAVKPTVSAKALKEDLPEVFAKYGKDTLVPGLRITKA